jgi:hypothetical protein
MLKRVVFWVVALLFVSPRVFAASYDVTAKVSAPMPTQLPVIASPNTNSEQQLPSVFVTGVCEVVIPQVVVLLVRGGETIGSGNCLPNGTFSILVGLVLGQNIIYPQYITITDDKSTLGAPIIVVYAPPVQPTSPKTNEEAPAQTEGLRLTFAYDFVTYSDLQKTKITYGIQGGTAPYEVVISWGDDTQTTRTITAAGEQVIEHAYKQLLPPEAKLTIRVTDAKQQSVVQTRALVSFRGGVYTPPAAPVLQEDKNWLLVWFVGVLCFGAILHLRHLGHAATKAHRSYHKRAKVAVKKKQKK